MAGNPRFDAWRAVHPVAPLWEYMAWIDRAKAFAFRIGHGVAQIDQPHGYLRVVDHQEFTAACVIFAASEL